MIDIKIEKIKIDVKDILLAPSLYKVAETNYRKSKTTGRPLFGGKNENEVLAKLQYAFSLDASTLEACNYADISPNAFYRYCKNNTDFRNKIDLLRTTVVFCARVAIFNAIIDGDMKTTRWYLERKLPQEFSVKGAEQYTLQAQQERIRYLENLLLKNGIYA